jgi:preprotein translocase subunit SecA
MDCKVVIVNENRVQALQGDLWSDDLLQAFVSKEGIEIDQESSTYASITMKNYFRIYEKLARMTGTAKAKAQEINDCYDGSLGVIPSHKKCIRVDFNGEI